MDKGLPMTKETEDRVLSLLNRIKNDWHGTQKQEASELLELIRPTPKPLQILGHEPSEMDKIFSTCKGRLSRIVLLNDRADLDN